MTTIPLGSGGEFDRVRAIIAALGPDIGPVGDDTAMIPGGDGALVISTDASMEGVHFRRAWLSLEEIGWRATASALSDLAAAAAAPSALVVALIVPRNTPESDLVDVMRGVGAAARSVGAQVIGGDLTSGREWGVVVTVVGRALRPLSRVGALPGNGVWVTGALGGARAALQAWTTGVEPDGAARLAFAHPVPRIGVAQWLASRGATAMMDLSDGLGGDAAHLAAASGVQLQLELERLPLHSSVAAAARRIGEPPEVFAATAGEDYELLLTLPADFDGEEACRHETGVPLTRIGSAGPGEGVAASLRGTVYVIQGFRHAV